MIISKAKHIVLRAKKTSSGFSLYLDISYHKKRIYEFLKLYISTDDKRKFTLQDKQTVNLAETIKAQRQIEINTNTYGLTQYQTDETVADYFEILANERMTRNDPSRWKWKAASAKFKECLADVSFENLNSRKLDQFKNYLLANIA